MGIDNLQFENFGDYGGGIAKEVLAVERVWSETVSVDFPDITGKYI